MKDKNQNDSIETLLKLAGKRVVPDEQLKKEVYANVHKAWKQHNKIPFYRSRIFLAAASLFIIVGFYALNLFSISDSEGLNSQLSKEIVLSGQIQSSFDQKNWSYLKTGSTLKIGEYLRTQSNNRILVILNNGNTFRLDENSLIQLVNEEHIELIMGQIYVESNENNMSNNLLIDTKFGTIKHIGTQYNVELKSDEINVSVRKGKVLVHNKNLSKEVTKNQIISINNKSNYKQSIINSYDEKWQWTQNITKHYNIQDKSVAQYLHWVSDETGYPIVWDSNNSKQKSNRIKLSGSIKGLKPIESLEVIMPTTDFNYTISQTAIHISE